MRAHAERHLSGRANWLRAAVLRANDGLVSVSSLILGVAASGASRGEILLAGIAALVAGALSMAAGEYVSVSSQRDSEAADLALEKRELAADPEGELRELASSDEGRGLPPELARQVAEQLRAATPSPPTRATSWAWTRRGWPGPGRRPGPRRPHSRWARRSPCSARWRRERPDRRWWWW